MDTRNRLNQTNQTPPAVHNRLRARIDTIRHSISEVPVIQVNDQTADQQEEEHGPDGGWGWAVLFSSFFCIAVLDGIAYTFGVFLDPLIVEMEEKQSKVSIAGSLLVATYAFAGPPSAKLVQRFGTRKVCMAGTILSAIGLLLGSFTTNLISLIITYSIITGAGFGCMYVPSVVAVANHFTKLRSIAIGICLCGAGVGTFALAPLESYITDNYGRKFAFRLLSCLCLVSCLLAVTMRPVKYVSSGQTESQEMIGQSSSEEPVSCVEKIVTLFMDRNLYRHADFMVFFCILIADIITTFGLFIPYHHLPPVARQAGLSKANADFLISVIGISSTIGRLVAGWVCDRKWLHPATLVTVSIVGVVPPLFIFCGTTSYYVFVVMSALFGALTGSWIALMSPLFVRILGLHLLTPAFGLLTGLRGVSALAGPPLAGRAVEYFNNRYVALYISGCCMAVGGIMFVLCTLCNRRRHPSNAQGYTQL